MKIILGLLILSAIASAAPNEQSTQVTSGQLMHESDNSVKPTGFVPYLGVNAGYTDQQNKNINSEGVPASIKLIGSYYLSNTQAVFDAGIGMMNQQFSRSAAQDRAISTGVAELAARYQFDNRVQAGIVGNQFFNKGENYGANQADAQFAGIQVLKEIGMDKGVLARVGARLMTDLNVDKKTVNMAMIDFQMGWNSKANKIPSVRDTAAVETAPVEQKAAPLTAEEIDKTAANFEVNSADVPAEKEAQLKKLSEALGKNPGLVREVQVIGHTDKTGTEKINEPLSEKRAENIAEILKENKPSSTKIEAQGVAAKQPISDDLRLNRRTELKFIGVSDEAKLKEILKSIE